MQITSLPVASAPLNETTASRSSPETLAPEKPFNAVLQKELAAHQKADTSNAGSTKMASPKPASSAHGSRSHVAASKPAEPAIYKAAQRNAADDAQAIDAGIATLSAELAAMVTNMLQLHASAAPADVDADGELPATDEGDSMSGNVPLDGNAAQLASLALVLQGLNSDASAPEAIAVTDLADLATPVKSAKGNRTDKVDLADSMASSMQARPPAPEAPLALQAARAGVSAELRADLSADFSADLSADFSADTAPLPGFATALQAAGSAVTSSVSTAAPAASTTLSAPPGTAAWNQALAQRVTWMVSGAVQSATLTLNPPELGPLHIVLNLSHAHADASFIASQPEVRQALEAALPKLREMLSEAGIQLGQASVSSGEPDSSGQFRQDAPRGTRAPRAVAANALPTEPASIAGRGLVGLIDTFA